MTKFRVLLVALLSFGLAISTLTTASATTTGTSNGFNYTTDGLTVTIDGCASACSGALTIPVSLTATGASSVTAISQNAFLNNTNITSLSLPSTLVSIGDGAFESNFALQSVVIPASVQSIGARAFYDTRALASVTIEANSNLVTIGQQAFQSAAFSTFTIPASVESIGVHVFTSIQNLTSIVVANGNTHFKIENDALLSANGTRYMAYPCGLANPVIPDSVTTIAAGAFYANGNFTEITIPASVTDIEDAAFAGNPGLHTVNFLGNAPTGAMYALTSMAWDGATLSYYTSRLGWNQYATDDSLTNPAAPEAVGLVFNPIVTNRYIDGAEFRGKLKVGKKVTFFRGNWEFISTTSYKFKWYACKKQSANQLESVRVPRNCKAISKNVSSIYKLKRNARKKYLAVVISAISEFGTVKVLIGSSKKVK